MLNLSAAASLCDLIAGTSVTYDVVRRRTLVLGTSISMNLNLDESEPEPENRYPSATFQFWS